MNVSNDIDLDQGGQLHVGHINPSMFTFNTQGDEHKLSCNTNESRLPVKG